MAQLLYIHWHADEASALAEPLRAAGHDVRVEHSAAALGSLATLRDDPPVAVVISLRRLVSHGREIADAFRSAAWASEIPIVFVAGDPKKVAATRRRFPEARYVETEPAVPLL